MPVYEFENKVPKIAQSSYLHPQAVLIGDVEIGKRCFIGAGAVLRGDFGRIRIGDGTSIQENCILHAGIDETLSIHDHVIVAHGAIVHEASVKSYVLVGMGSILMNRAFCEDHVLIAAGSIVKEGFHIPPKVVVGGNPAKIMRPISRDEIRAIHDGVKLYQQLAKRYLKNCKKR